LLDSDGSDYLRTLERMVNQIADNFASDPEHGATAIADHLKRFWDPTMRRDLVEAASAGNISLSGLVGEAVAITRQDVDHSS